MKLAPTKNKPVSAMDARGKPRLSLPRIVFGSSAPKRGPFATALVSEADRPELFAWGNAFFEECTHLGFRRAMPCLSSGEGVTRQGRR